ncbi:hypothetical protein AB4144_67060, partial [Rhizobiaceae sp. 2RAB30]
MDIFRDCSDRDYPFFQDAYRYSWLNMPRRGFRMTVHGNIVAGLFSSRQSARPRKYSGLLRTASLLAFGLPFSGGFAFADP